MKIVIVTQYPKQQDKPHGGVEAVSVNLVRGLSSYSDLEVHVVTFDRNETSVCLDKFENYTVHRLPRPKHSELLNAVLYGKKRMENYVSGLKPDFIHAHDTYGMMMQDVKFPKIFTIHGFIYGDTLFSNKPFAQLRSRLWKYFETRSWSKQPNIISISPYVRERLSGIATGSIFDIDNPISADFFDVTRDVHPGTIFSAAVISPRKNTLKLIEAINLLKSQGIETKLRLAGSVVDKDYGDILQAYVKENSLGNDVIFLGKLSREEVKKELSHAAVFALVSLEENSPMGIEEAMAAGVPVVTSNMCGMPYMVSYDESGYLVNPSEITDISDKIKRLLDIDRNKDFSEKSKEIARERFHPDVVTRKTLNLYRELLS